jgi:hypothetical protein
MISARAVPARPVPHECLMPDRGYLNVDDTYVRARSTEEMGEPPGPGRLPGNAYFSFPGCEGDALLMLLDARHIACSTGSACTADTALKPILKPAKCAPEAHCRYPWATRQDSRWLGA